MKDFEVEYDAKAHTFSLDHTNILKEDAKDYDKTLNIKPFQVAVQIAFDKDVRVANPDEIEQEMIVVADELEEQVHQEIRELDAKIQKLKKEEEAGNKTASQEADKEVKLTKKKLEKLAGDFGMKTRVVVETLLTKQSRGGKVKCRSASRTGLRGLELDDDFFDDKAKSEPDPYFGKLAQTLATSGKEIAKLTLEERDMRKSLSDEIKRIHKLVETDRGGKSDYDIKAFAKGKQSTEARKLETLANKYMEFVTSMDEKLDALQKNLSNVEKLVKDAGSPDDQKQIQNHVKEYDDALWTVKGTIEDKLEGGRCAQHLLKDEYEQGEHWTDLASFLDARKAAANSGARLQDHGAALAKLTKK